MKNNIEVKKSNIEGQGVFAKKDFVKGEVVLRWNSETIEELEIEKIPDEERKYIFRNGGKIYYMQPPERFVNHSCNPNTFAENGCDIALRDIKAGEEITSDYGREEKIAFKCNCKSENCKK